MRSTFRLFFCAWFIFSLSTLSSLVFAKEIKPKLMIALSSSGADFVSVGAMGDVFRFNKGLKQFQKGNTPSSRLLTSVYFYDEALGWAVGHDEIILKTVDGGKNWKKVHANPENERPLLDLIFLNNKKGFAFGAYGVFLSTNDGGDSWMPMQLTVENDDFHLNSVTRVDNGNLYVASESGVAYVSKDNGLTWNKLASPYSGSLFGATGLSNNRVLFVGLQGRALVYSSDDGGWRNIVLNTKAVLNDAEKLPNGSVIIAGNDGTLLLSDEQFYSIRPLKTESRDSIADVLALDDETLLLAGDFGVKTYKISASK